MSDTEQPNVYFACWAYPMLKITLPDGSRLRFERGILQPVDAEQLEAIRESLATMDQRISHTVAVVDRGLAQQIVRDHIANSVRTTTGPTTAGHMQAAMQTTNAAKLGEMQSTLDPVAAAAFEEAQRQVGILPTEPAQQKSPMFAKK